MNTIKNISLLLILSLFVFSCSNSTSKDDEPNTQSDSTQTSLKFGDTTINADGAVEVAQLSELFAGKDSVAVKLTGEIKSVCQKKGCWMTMNVADDQELFIKFKDYGFFVPKNASSQNAIIDGYAYVDTVSVADQKHYASDDGQTEEEIAQITEPKVQYTFQASGVIIE